MGVIKNYSTLATSPERKVVLDLIEIALQSIQPKHILAKHVSLKSDILTIQDKQYNLKDFERIFLIGLGKGSSGICKFIENILGEKLTQGFDIDVVDETFNTIQYTKGTHPLPSQINIDYTKHVVNTLSELGQNDLVIVVICGGGSAMFEIPVLPLETMEELSKQLLRSGANIKELNIIRKHLSLVKGGGLAKLLDPAKIVSLMFSDVPGNDFSTIASGPTTLDPYTKEDAIAILKKYHITLINEDDLIDLPKAHEYFERVDNLLMVSNMTALQAMKNLAEKQGISVQIHTDKLQGNAKEIGKELIDATKNGEILLAGGETTMVVQGTGKGGRNQAMVLASLPYITEQITFAAFDSDGWDFSTFAGAIGDIQTAEKAKQQGLDNQVILDNDDSTTFFEKVGDGIDTGKLESNVSDLMIVYKK